MYCVLRQIFEKILPVMHALSIFIFFCDDKSWTEVQPGYAAAVAEHAQHLIR